MFSSAPKQLLKTKENGLRHCLKPATFLQLSSMNLASMVSIYRQEMFRPLTPACGFSGKRAAFRLSGAFCAECCPLMATLLRWSREMIKTYTEKRRSALLPFSNILPCYICKNLWRYSYLC